MKTYTWYLISAYGSVFGALALIGWISIRNAIVLKKRLRKQVSEPL